MSEESVIEGWEYFDEEENDPMAIDRKIVPKHVRVYEISGPMFFGMADQIAENIHAKDFTRVMIIRMRGVPALDATAMKSLEDLQKRAVAKNIQLVFSHVNEQPMRTMEKDGFVDLVGREHFCPNIDAALEHAASL